jgi:surface antigen
LARTRRKSTRRKLVRIGFLAANLVIVVVIAGFVLQNPKSSAATPALLGSDGQAAVANPMDQLSSAAIAETVARMESLPETNAITNQADSQTAELTLAPTNDDVVSKPQVVATALKSRADIQTYVAKGTDTLASIATQFGVTSDSIRWSNSLTGLTIKAGQSLTIPPVNGIVYTVKAGDTAASLASKFNSNQAKIVAFNDAEITGLTTGEQVVIPDGTEEAAATAASISSAADDTTYPWGGTAIYGSNGYDYGYCTWYVATQVSVPSNWGNANTWDNLAPLSGWTVSTTPRVGAIAQTDAGYEGHVAYVVAVSPDSSQIMYRDMNGLAGFGRVGYSGWVSSTHFEHYIYR